MMAGPHGWGRQDARGRRNFQLSNFRLLETDGILFFSPLWISEAGCVEKPIISQLLLK